MVNQIPTLQKKILLDLAVSEPSTINEIAKRLDKQYKAVHFAVKSLLKKDLITEKSIKEYRGRKFPALWLTERGIMAAFLFKVTREKLKENVLEIYGKEKAEDLQFWCGLEKIFPWEFISSLLELVILRRKVTAVDTFSLVECLIKAMKENGDILPAYAELLAKNPRIQKQVKDIFAIVETLKELLNSVSWTMKLRKNP